MATMSRRVIWCLFVGLQSIGSFAWAQSQSAVPPSPQRAILDKYCVTCHNQKAKVGGLALDRMDVADIGSGAEIWEKVLRKVSTGEMPPPKMPRPTQAQLDDLRSWLEAKLDQAAVAKPNPGRIAIHRLNQTEYSNAIRDLLALDIDGRALLGADEAGGDGFDNMAGALTVSPVLVERYLSAARKVSRLAIGDSSVIPAIETVYVPTLLNQDRRDSEDLPFGSRGGVAVHHRFPVDGEYTVKVRLRNQLYDYILGLGRPHRLDIRLDGKLIKQFTVGGDAPGNPAPVSFSGNIAADASWELYMHNADEHLEVRFPARAGDRVVGVSFAEEIAEPEGVVQPAQGEASGLPYNELYDGNAAVKTVSIGGPFRVDGLGDTASRRAIFTCRPSSETEELPCARKILSTLARRAYRRPVTESDIHPLLGFYETGRKQGDFELGIQTALQRILTDPEFLFRLERDPANVAAGSVFRLTDLELASRLSFFLWSSIPDEQLLDLAAHNKLRAPGVLDQQVRRMLADRRSAALADNFAGQWLGLPKLRGVAPDRDEFPQFDETLRADFQKETQLFIESQFRADRSPTELLSANYTFLNERLARHYGVPGVYGGGFRRVTFKDGERGGLLGQGSILTITSYANRTSPVLRGKWVLDTLLAMAPPPPPPDIPVLPETGANGRPVSVRQRMEEHRKNPACAGCHVRMDPIGFSLENFDAIGQWRTAGPDGARIDVSGVFPDGTKFQGVAGLRSLLLSHREQFVGVVTQKLLAWALGRSIEYYDLPAVRKIVRDGASKDDCWTALVAGVVNSTPFQMSIVENSTPRPGAGEIAAQRTNGRSSK
jgi:hypothetical protein